MPFHWGGPSVLPSAPKPHRSPPFAASRPMARSLARSTARAALRLLSSLRRFLFDLVMVASLHQLRCYPQPTPHGSLVARLTLQHAMSTTVTQPLRSPPLLPARHASPSGSPCIAIGGKHRPL